MVELIVQINIATRILQGNDEEANNSVFEDEEEVLSSFMMNSQKTKASKERVA